MAKLTNDELKQLAIAVIIKSSSDNDIPAVAEQVYHSYKKALEALDDIIKKEYPICPSTLGLLGGIDK